MTASFLEQMDEPIHNTRNVVKRKVFRSFIHVMRGPRPAHLPQARDGRIKSGHDDFSRLSPE